MSQCKTLVNCFSYCLLHAYRWQVIYKQISNHHSYSVQKMGLLDIVM